MPQDWSGSRMGLSSFFGGFGNSLMQGQQEAQKRKFEREHLAKKQAVDLLTGLLDDTTPDTRSTLLKQIADTMSLKGPHRSFWDELTGRGQFDQKQAIGQKLQEVFSNTMGQGQYQNELGRGATNAAFQALDTGDANIPQTLANYSGLGGKIALHDPNLERMQYMREQTGLQTSAREQAASAREQDIQDRQIKLKNLGAELTTKQHEADQWGIAMRDVRKRAIVLAGGKRPLDEDLESAAHEIASEQGLNVDLLKARIGLAGANKDKAQAEARSLVTTTDPMTGQIMLQKPMTISQKQQSDQAQQQAGIAIYQKWSDSRAKAAALGNQIQILHNQIESQAKAWGLLYDAEKGLITDTAGKPSIQSRQFDPLIKQAASLQADKDRAMSEMQGHWSTLNTQFGTYYKLGQDAWWVEPRQSFGGVAPAGAARATPDQPVYDATVPQVRGKKTGGSKAPDISSSETVIGTAENPASRFKPGEVKVLNGRRYKIASVEPPSSEYPYGFVTLIPSPSKDN